MNWSGLFSRSGDQSSGGPRVPAATPLQKQRVKQIESLRLFNQKVVEINRDTQYKVDFQTAGNDISLIITLPEQFPNEKPLVMVSSVVQHPWVDDQMNVIGCSALNNFYMHSNLGRVIQSIVKEFQEHPPYVFGNQHVTGSTRKDIGGYKISSSTFYTAPPLAQDIVNGPLISVETPEIPKPYTNGSVKSRRDTDDIMEKLRNLRISQLEDLNDNPDHLFEEIKEMKSIKDLQVERDKLLSESEECARANLELKEEITLSKENYSKHFDKHTKLKQDFDSLFQQQQEHREVYDVGSIVTNLRIAAMQAEEASEEVAEDFLNGKIAVDEFLKQFLDQRKLSHARKAKEEKIRGTLSGF